jgi:hypothetical protein
MLNASLRDYFPDEDYRFHLSLGRMNPPEFFTPTPGHDALLAQRAPLLQTADRRYADCTDTGASLLRETAQLATAWGQVSPAVTAKSHAGAGELCRALGREWEADFLLLKSGDDGEMVLHGGCVCFPSSWAFEEKLGRPLPWIHDAVPGLNAALQQPIGRFLDRLRPGTAYTRWNWGLSRWPQLNQHPSLGLTKLAPPLAVDDVWLRLEDQALVALPETGGVLFGIRIWVVSLGAVQADTDAAHRLHRAIATMPEPMLRYKNLWDGKDELLRLLG